MGGQGSGRKPRTRPKGSEPLANGAANGSAGPAVVGDLPTRRLFPFSRGPGLGGFTTRLPPRVPVAASPIAGSTALGAALSGTTAAPPVVPPRAVVPPQPEAPPPPPAPAIPPAPAPAPHVPRPVLPTQHGAADQNAYRERQAERESHRWGKRSDVLQPEASSLVQAWTYYLSIYPPAALTIWLRRTSPVDNSYDLFVSGEDFIGETYPDRALYEKIRRARRQPAIAETFSGRIQGRSAEGQPLDVGGGDLRLPPEPTAQPAPWGQPQGPWGAPPAYGPPAPPYGPWGPPGAMGWPGAPGMMPGAGPYSPWGMGMMPWWAMFAGAPGGAPAAPAAPPASIAQDPGLMAMWQAIKEIQVASSHMNADQASRANALQMMMLEKLMDRVGAPAAASAGGGMREQIGLLKDVAGLVNELRGGGGGGASDGGDALQIVEMKSGEKIFAQKGKVHEGLTYGFAIKDAATDLFKGLRNIRPGVRPGAAAAAPVTVDAPVDRAQPARSGITGGGLPARTPVAKANKP